MINLRDVSGRKRAEEELRQSEERYRAVIEQVAEGIYLLDARTKRVLDTNPALQKMLGYTAEELLGMEIHEFIAHDRVDVDSHLRRTLEQRHRFVGERKYRRKDGSLVDVEVGVNTISYDGTEVVCVVVRDVTGRERTETALRESERRHRRQARELMLLHQVRTALARESRPSSMFRAVVEAIVEAYGYTLVSAYLLQGDALVLQHQVGYETVIERIPTDRGITGRVARTGLPVLLEDVRGDPSFLDAVEGITSEVCVPLFDDGKVVGILNVESTDSIALTEDDLRLITAVADHVGIAVGRARLYAQAREAEEKYRTLVEQIPAATYVMDLVARRLVYASPQMETMLGYSPQDGTFGDWIERIHVEDRERVISEITRSRETGEPFSAEYRLVMGDARVLWVHDRAALLRSADDEPRFMQGVRLDITDHKMLEERLGYRAFHDVLTGLPNRASLTGLLQHILGNDRRSVALLILDLDDFRLVNDSLGYDAGDSLLTAVAGRLKACLRPKDVVACLSEDEFAILLDNVPDADYAVRVAERIEEELQAPLTIGEHEALVTASIGIVLATPDHDRPEDLLRDAEVAMHRAKDGGKAQHRVFDPSMDPHSLQLLELRKELRLAVEWEELDVRYEPEALLDNEGVVGMKVSAYWEHPQKGLVSPSEFMPAAEGTSLSLRIGRMLLKEACLQARGWQDRFPSDLPPMVRVTLSARQFRRKDLAEEISVLLRQTGLRPRSLNLGITENTAMRDVRFTTARLEELKALGVQLTIEKFGTSYSSLGHLSRLPVDFLEIDRSFVDELREGSAGAAVVSGIISLAHALGLTATVEGVDTAEQAAQLRRMGCNLARGDHFSEPQTAADATALLAEHGFPWCLRSV